MIVTEVVFNQGWFADVQLHVAFIDRHEHLVELGWVGRQTSTIKLQISWVAALLALVELLLGVVHVSLWCRARLWRISLRLLVIALRLLLIVVVVVVTLRVRIVLLVVASTELESLSLTSCSLNSLPWSVSTKLTVIAVRVRIVFHHTYKIIN